MFESSDEVRGATELLLQSTVAAGLESAAKQVSDLRAREATRLAEYNGRGLRPR